ncbi:unnamed protein product [Arabidopsis thaliana]|uniref:TIP41-like protein n=3 Tax=Arabidopsis TaxID=3701 RepID=Q84JE0_ARATH|nr:TIP41-like protein [Arabidopsis thaliana]KAG7634346.1 hypothetical protein ISN44_As03g045710 [Arabidopsis suecica]AAO41940.1 unknown protein [Arabidopsis thaliana]AAO50648.1 unknown protein [Arabidopsis thaliana]AEE79173.1 TIP41-like protein [Arabidopsis thaliana]CAA0386256.1 unnamed protein product [Arabidopsis thaliana]|eukprot:NP_566992.1 TIP41-like protein [Arabidopsis thaliana]
MEPPSSVVDDAEFWLPTEFLTDDDFLVEKENNSVGIDDSLFPYEPRHGFGTFGSTVKPNTVKEDDEESFLAGLTRQMVMSSLKDDFSGGVCGNHAFPAGNDHKAWEMNRSPPCVAGTGCCCLNQRFNQNLNSRVSSWDLYCAAERMSINDEPYHSGRGLLGSPAKLSATVKNHSNNGTGYYNNHQSLQYQKLQAIQFQQLKQQQLMKHRRQLVRQNRGVRVNGNKNVGPVDLSSSAWSNQFPRRDVMRAVFIGDHTGKRGSTGTGVFLPRSVNHTSRTETREKPTISTVLVPARLAQVLNLNLGEPVRSTATLNDVSWRQRSNNGGFSSQMVGGVRAEQSVQEPRLPSEWAY